MVSVFRLETYSEIKACIWHFIEYVVGWYERSRPHQWYSPGVLAEYVKALVKTDKLDKSELFSVLQEGKHLTC